MWRRLDCSHLGPRQCVIRIKWGNVAAGLCPSSLDGFCAGQSARKSSRTRIPGLSRQRLRDAREELSRFLSRSQDAYRTVQKQQLKFRPEFETPEVTMCSASRRTGEHGPARWTARPVPMCQHPADYKLGGWAHIQNQSRTLHQYANWLMSWQVVRTDCTDVC